MRKAIGQHAVIKWVIFANHEFNPEMALKEKRTDMKEVILAHEKCLILMEPWITAKLLFANVAVAPTLLRVPSQRPLVRVSRQSRLLDEQGDNEMKQIF